MQTTVSRARVRGLNSEGCKPPKPGTPVGVYVADGEPFPPGGEVLLWLEDPRAFCADLLARVAAEERRALESLDLESAAVEVKP